MNDDLIYVKGCTENETDSLSDIQIVMLVWEECGDWMKKRVKWLMYKVDYVSVRCFGSMN